MRSLEQPGTSLPKLQSDDPGSQICQPPFGILHHTNCNLVHSNALTIDIANQTLITKLQPPGRCSLYDFDSVRVQVAKIMYCVQIIKYKFYLTSSWA